MAIVVVPLADLARAQLSIAIDVHCRRDGGRCGPGAGVTTDAPQPDCCRAAWHRSIGNSVAASAGRRSIKTPAGRMRQVDSIERYDAYLLCYQSGSPFCRRCLEIAHQHPFVTALPAGDDLDWHHCCCSDLPWARLWSLGLKNIQPWLEYF